MLFIGVALLIAAALALFIASDAGSVVGLTQEQTGQLIPLLLILILVAGGAFGRRRKLGDLLTGLVLWAGIFGVVIAAYAYREELNTVAGRVFGELAPGRAVVSADGGSARFRRGLGGSFLINVAVNGRQVPMIFDTGATAVVLTHEDALQAGVPVTGLTYDVRVQTANGVGWAANTRLARIMIGDIERRDIKAYVTERGALQTSLLGMSFLETLSSYTVAGSELELVD